MRFHLTDEQDAMREAIKGAVSKALPSADSLRLLDAESDLHAPTWQALMELGVGGLLAAEERGGEGLGIVDGAVVMEALGEIAAPGPVLAQVLAALALDMASDEGLRREWLPGVMTGQVKATVGFGDGWFPGTWSAVAGQGTVSGDLGFVLGGDVADFFLVGTEDGGLSLVERADAQVDQLDCVDRTRRVARVRLDGARGRPVCGAEAAARVTDIAFVLLAADALGGAEASLTMSRKYALEREQFGRRIAEFQAVKHQLASMAIEVEPSRALLWYAAYALDQSLGEAPRMASHAKAHLADRFASVARAAIRVHGGIGYTWEYPLQVYFRRSLFDQAYLGSPRGHRERVAALAGW